MCLFPLAKLELRPYFRKANGTSHAEILLVEKNVTPICNLESSTIFLQSYMLEIFNWSITYEFLAYNFGQIGELPPLQHRARPSSLRVADS